MVKDYRLELLRKIESTDEITSFYFKKPSGFHYKPGQYVKVTVKLEVDDSKGNTRFFTLSSSPSEDYLMIATKMQPSEFKKKLYELEIGERLQIRGPYGSFVFDADTKKVHVFIAGGMGITPFRSMIRFSVDESLEVPMILIYSYNSTNNAVFLDELRDVTQKNPRLTTYFIDSSQHGHIDSQMIKKSLENYKNCVYYITGPTEMVDEVSAILSTLKVPESDVSKEYFSGYMYE